MFTLSLSFCPLISKEPMITKTLQDRYDQYRSIAPSMSDAEIRLEVTSNSLLALTEAMLQFVGKEKGEGSLLPLIGGLQEMVSFMYGVNPTHDGI